MHLVDAQRALHRVGGGARRHPLGVVPLVVRCRRRRWRCSGGTSARAGHRVGPEAQRPVGADRPRTCTGCPAATPGTKPGPHARRRPAARADRPGRPTGSSRPPPARPGRSAPTRRSWRRRRRPPCGRGRRAPPRGGGDGPPRSGADRLGRASCAMASNLRAWTMRCNTRSDPVAATSVKSSRRESGQVDVTRTGGARRRPDRGRRRGWPARRRGRRGASSPRSRPGPAATPWPPSMNTNAHGVDQ